MEQRAVVVAAALGWVPAAYADVLLEGYEADVMPEDAGFVSIPCDNECSASLEGGHLVLRWVGGGETVAYSKVISNMFQEPPPPDTFWVEWRFRSDTSFTPPNNFPCDADFVANYKNTHDLLQMMGDAVVSFDKTTYRALEPGEFYTYRFESLDGVSYAFFVNGDPLLTAVDNKNYLGVHFQMRGRGSCVGDETNEWDFVRWGEIGYGETIVSSDPPAGVVNAAAYPNLDRFTVTFDQPNYVLVDEVTVDVTSSATERRSDEATEGDEVLHFAQNDGAVGAIGVPQVIATRRLDNGPADTVEIVLDGPLPLNATTTFTVDDGAAVNVVEYTYAVIGACCLADGACIETDEAECDDLGGTFNPPSSPLGKGGGNRGGGTFTAGGTCEGDADGDEVDGSCGDGCPADADKLAPGQCGCGNPDLDTDEDSVADCLDQCDGEDDRLDADQNGTPDCAEFQPIPTTTAWGVGILSLLLLITAKVRSR